jgi:hypothetical protein
MRARLLSVVCFTLLGAAVFGPEISLANNAAPFPKVTYVKFEDPFEHAFTAEVPEGWEAKGGVYRLGFSDARAMLDLSRRTGKSTFAWATWRFHLIRCRRKLIRARETRWT